MLDILRYTFFQNALLGVVIVSIVSAMIGTYIVTRRMVFITGGVTHACFGGLGVGYFVGISPIFMAGVFAVASSLGVEWMATKQQIREDSAIAVVWALGMAIGTLFIFLTPGYVPELNSFLFGNILTITRGDLVAFVVYMIAFLAFFILFYNQIVSCAFDRDFAKTKGQPVVFINTMMTVMTAICVVLTIRLIGIMLLMSLLTMPQMIAELFVNRFKSMFIDALSYVTEKKYDKFKSTLKDMLQRYPETDITPTASSILKQIDKGRKLEGGGTNVRGMLWSTRLSNDSTAAGIEKKFTPFKENRDTPQMLVLTYPTDTVSANQLLFDIAKHNFSTFVVKDFDLEQMTFGRLGLLIIKGFANFDELSHYKSVLEADKELKLPPSVKMVLISVDNFNLLLKEGRSFEDYFNFLETKNTEKVEKSALKGVKEGEIETPQEEKSMKEPAAEAESKEE